MHIFMGCSGHTFDESYWNIPNLFPIQISNTLRSCNWFYNSISLDLLFHCILFCCMWCTKSGLPDELFSFMGLLLVEIWCLLCRFISFNIQKHCATQACQVFHPWYSSTENLFDVEIGNLLALLCGFYHNHPTVEQIFQDFSIVHFAARWKFVLQ